MATKLWEKDFQMTDEIERFTVGRDREMGLYLAPFDVLGSMAHITMLQSIGLLTDDELRQLLQELKNIYALCQEGSFTIELFTASCSRVSSFSSLEPFCTRPGGTVGSKFGGGCPNICRSMMDWYRSTGCRSADAARHAHAATTRSAGLNSMRPVIYLPL